MSGNTLDPRRAIYTPQQVARIGVMNAEFIEANKGFGIHLGIERIDGYFAPALPGQLVVILAQTSHYKSGFLHAVEYNIAKDILDEGRQDDIVVHVSVEEGVEEQSYLEFCRLTGEFPGKVAIGEVKDWGALKSAAIEASVLPIYRIGNSLERAEDIPELYLSNIEKSLHTLQNDLLDWKPRFSAIFFDYLQALPFDAERRRVGMEDRRSEQVKHDIYRMRELANLYKCPVFVAVQAKQELAGAKPPVMIPDQYDCKESSYIPERADRIITLWMPKKTSVVGETFDYTGRQWTVAENMLWLKVAKQRGGLPSGAVFPCRVDFARNKITPDPDVYRLR